jgi:hypothetical protein
MSGRAKVFGRERVSKKTFRFLVVAFGVLMDTVTGDDPDDDDDDDESACLRMT